MDLPETQKLLARDLAGCEAMELLASVLEASIELLSLEGNDFFWSSWHDAHEALIEVRSLLTRIKNGSLPKRPEVAVLFAPTGPIQEVSLSSGWAETFLKIAERYEYAERHLWKVD